jgi:hypothetical protein
VKPLAPFGDEVRLCKCDATRLIPLEDGSWTWGWCLRNSELRRLNFLLLLLVLGWKGGFYVFFVSLDGTLCVIFFSLRGEMLMLMME